MTNKISIRSVQLEWLDSRCLLQISKYTKRRFDLDTEIMDLRDPDILQHVFAHAHKTEDEQLKSIYQTLRREIQNCLADKSISKEVFSSTIPDYLITDSEDSKVSRKEVVKRWFDSRISSSD